jgi:hypothetical protein
MFRNTSRPERMCSEHADPRIFPHRFQQRWLVSDQVAAQLMSISLATLRRMRSRGEGPPRRQISLRRYGTRLRDIAEFLNRAAV